MTFVFIFCFIRTRHHKYFIDFREWLWCDINHIYMLCMINAMLEEYPVDKSEMEKYLNQVLVCD